jgi:hypothetical protein
MFDPPPRAIRLLLACFGFAMATHASAQALPVVLGEPVVEAAAKSSAPSYLLTTEEEMPAHRLRLASPADRELRTLEDVSSPYKRARIGIGREVAEHAVEGTGQEIAWSRVGEWRIAKLRVQSPGAKSMRVGLQIGATREPWTLRVAGSDDESKALGPVRLAGPLGQNEIYWTPLTEGDAQVVEIASPATQPEPRVEVARVSHLATGPSSLFRKTVGDIGDSGSCNIDVKCVPNPSQALLNAASAVVHMLFTGLTGSSSMCTGTLLNDTHQGTQIPYLYSANHCFEKDDAPFATPTQMQQVASSLNSFFFFDAVACRNLATPPYVQRFGGATYLYNSLPQDVLFVKLNEWAPAGAWLTGWDANAITPGAAVTVLHHPRGDLKKFSTGATRNFVTLPSPLNATRGFIEVIYNQGTAEPGSSGGGLLTHNGSEYLLRGGLLGGEASCTATSLPDWYSRLDQVYSVLAQWLTATALPDMDVTDLWYIPSESGWGLNLTQHPSNNVFGVWYTYASDFGPLWLVMAGGQWTTSRTFTGRLYRTSGPGYNQATFDPARVKVTDVGSLTLNFTGANNAIMTWVVDGVQGSEAVTRLNF